MCPSAVCLSVSMSVHLFVRSSFCLSLPGWLCVSMSILHSVRQSVRQLVHPFCLYPLLSQRLTVPVTFYPNRTECSYLVCLFLRQVFSHTHWPSCDHDHPRQRDGVSQTHLVSYISCCLFVCVWGCLFYFCCCCFGVCGLFCVCLGDETQFVKFTYSLFSLFIIII